MDALNSVMAVNALAEEKNTSQLKELLRTLTIDEIVDLFNELPAESKSFVFLTIPASLASRIFKVLEVRVQKELFEFSSPDQAAKLLVIISPDDRTAFLENLSGEAVKELLLLLPESELKTTLSLLGYPEHSVGRLMTPNYLAVKKEWTVQQVLDYIRESGRNSETINFIYVTDDKGILIDDIRIKEFLFASPEQKVGDLTDGKFIFLTVTDDEEVAVNEFRQTNRFALPVIDENKVLLGCVTIDDVLRLAEEEETEDIQKFGGVEVLEQPYMEVPFLTLMKKRSGWLVILFMGEMLTATAMGHFEEDISVLPLLAIFIPLIISSGGNSGSQASTLIIRALALGEVTVRDWWKIMRREISSGLFIGTVLGAIGFIRISIWQYLGIYNYTSAGHSWLLVAMTIFFALIGVVMWGTLTGSMLPVILKKMGFDPATSSAPFVATLVDVTGIIIYFTVATLIILR